MISATMHEAKTNLSALVKRAQDGEQVIITSGREKVPAARIVPMEPARKPQRLGLLAGRSFTLPTSFDEPLPDDELLLWEGHGE